MSGILNPFSRYTVPDPRTNRVVQDIYDKLQQNQSSLTAVQKLASSAQTGAQVQAAIAASSSSSSSETGELARIPQVSPLPPSNPAESPLAVDGSLVEFAPSPSSPGTLYR